MSEELAEEEPRSWLGGRRELAKKAEKAGPVQANVRDGRSQGESVSAPTVERSAEPGTFRGGRLGLAKRRTEGSRATPLPFYLAHGN